MTSRFNNEMVEIDYVSAKVKNVLKEKLNFKEHKKGF